MVAIWGMIKPYTRTILF